MPAVLAGGLVGTPPPPASEDPFPMRHPLLAYTAINPVWTTQAAYDAVWFGRGWLPWP
jgi:hypothetical protein